MILSLPEGSELKGLLNLETPAEIDDLLNQSLISPLREFFSRPRKDIRGEMVKMGYFLVHPRQPLLDPSMNLETEKACETLSEVLEFLHAGSLMVDDIQDGSQFRRGAQAMHELYGLPLALNAGNWLYFWPFQKIQELNLSAETRLKLFQECHSTLHRAHFGQALDLGTPITSLEQNRIPDVCMATLQLKTGALMSLALKLGAILAEAQEDQLQALDHFGHHFGIALQMFDDIGNLSSKRNPEKRFEDLKNRRPSYVWCVAAQRLRPQNFAYFCEMVYGLPASEKELISFLSDFDLAAKAKASAREYLEDSLSALQRQLSLNETEILKLHHIKQELFSAYE